MKRIITYGSFDLLHYGHIELLRRAKAMGDYLIVALSTDEFSASKGKRAYFSYEQRKAMLEAVRYVDMVVPERTWGQKSQDIDEYGIDVFVIGDDWIGTFDEQLEGRCEIAYLPRTPATAAAPGPPRRSGGSRAVSALRRGDCVRGRSRRRRA